MSSAEANAAMKARRIRIGVLGGGMISQIAHLPFYANDPRCEIVAVAESRPSLMAALAAEFGADRITADHEAVLARPDVDAVVISAPRPATGPLTLMALKAGKHVLAEKPMAHSAEQAKRLVEAATERKLIYAVGFMKRYDPGVHAARILFDALRGDGRLGRLQFARFYDYSNAYAVTPPVHVRPKESRIARFPVWALHPNWLPEQYHGNYAWFLNAGSHDVNLLRFFFPEPLDIVSARIHEGVVTVTFSAGGSPVGLEVVKAEAGRWIEGAEFVFERGRLGVSIPSPMAVEAVSVITLDDKERGISNARQPAGEGWSFMLQAHGFVGALSGERAPLTDAAEGLADMILIERIWQRAVGIV